MESSWTLEAYNFKSDAITSVLQEFSKNFQNNCFAEQFRIAVSDLYLRYGNTIIRRTPNKVIVFDDITCKEKNVPNEFSEYMLKIKIYFIRKYCLTCFATTNELKIWKCLCEATRTVTWTQSQILPTQDSFIFSVHSFTFSVCITLKDSSC